MIPYEQSLATSTGQAGPPNSARITVHEQALAAQLCDEIERQARNAGALAVRAVGVQLGPLSGVEPLLLASAFEQLAPERLGCDCRLTWEEVPLELVCRQCERHFHPPNLNLFCPDCGSGDAELLSGDSLVLKRMVVELPPEPAAAD